MTIAFDLESAKRLFVSVVVSSNPNLRPACTPLTPALDAMLRKLDPADPVKSDSALFGLGAIEKW